MEDTDKPAASKPGRKQLQIAGTERKRIQELDQLAETYRAVRDDRMELTKAEKNAKLLLLECAKKHEIDSYVYESEDGEEFAIEVEIEESEDIKVRKIKKDDE